MVHHVIKQIYKYWEVEIKNKLYFIQIGVKRNLIPF